MSTYTSLSSKTRFVVLSVFVGVASLTLSACQLGSSTPAQPAETMIGQEEELSGFTTLTGTIQVQGTQAFLKTTTGTTTLQSYSLNLSEYNGQTVTVTGKFSGDELFVSELQPAQ